MTAIQTTNPHWDDEDEILGDAFAVHPGTILKDIVLPERGIKAMVLADRIGVPRPGFNNMLNAKRAITPTLALKIERATGYPAHLLVTMQAAHDLATVSHNPETMQEIERITVMA